MSKLHEHSEWETARVVNGVVDEFGVRVVFEKTGVISLEDSGEYCEAYADDLLAVIDRAGLDPVRVAARELLGKLELQDNHPDVDAVLKKLEALL